MLAHHVLFLAVTEKEATHVASKSISLMPAIRDGLEHAFQQDDHLTTKFSLNRPANSYLKLLKQIVAVHPQGVEVSVRAGMLPLAARALHSDPNEFYSEVHYAAKYVQQVLQASAGKHVNDVRKVGLVKEGVPPPYFHPHFFYMLQLPPRILSHANL